MDWNGILQTVEKWLREMIRWFDENPIYLFFAALWPVGELIALVRSEMSLRKSKRQEREERALKEEQMNLNREISDKLSRYEELFGDLDINRQLKQLLAERETKIQEADQALEQLDLSIDERERIKAQREDDLRSLEEEKRAFLAQKEEDIRKVEARLQQVVATAQNEALRETIKKRLLGLERELSEIEALKQEYALTDDALDLPQDVKDSLKQSLYELVPQRQEILPQPYVIQVFFLVLLILVLPNPIDNLILIISVVPIFIFVVDAVKYLKSERLNGTFIKWYRILTFLTLYTLSLGIFTWLRYILDPLLDRLYETINQALHMAQGSQFVTGLSDDIVAWFQPTVWTASVVWIKLAKFGLDIAQYILAFVFSIVDYSRVIKPISKKVLSTLGKVQVQADHHYPEIIRNDE